MQIVLENTDLYGTNGDPGFGIMGVASNKIGYREPHDHGPCWAINIQVKGRLRMVHWDKSAVDEATGHVTLRKVDEVTLGPGDVDYSAPGIAHELFPESEDSVEMAVRCHSLVTIIQNRYDLSDGTYKRWSWGKRETVGTGEFEVEGGYTPAEPPPSALTSRLD